VTSGKMWQPRLCLSLASSSMLLKQMAHQVRLLASQKRYDSHAVISGDLKTKCQKQIKLDSPIQISDLMQVVARNARVCLAS